MEQRSFSQCEHQTPAEQVRSQMNPMYESELEQQVKNPAAKYASPKCNCQLAQYDNLVRLAEELLRDAPRSHPPLVPAKHHKRGISLLSCQRLEKRCHVQAEAADTALTQADQPRWNVGCGCRGSRRARYYRTSPSALTLSERHRSSFLVRTMPAWSVARGVPSTNSRSRSNTNTPQSLPFS